MNRLAGHNLGSLDGVRVVPVGRGVRTHGGHSRVDRWRGRQAIPNHKKNDRLIILAPPPSVLFKANPIELTAACPSESSESVARRCPLSLAKPGGGKDEWGGRPCPSSREDKTCLLYLNNGRGRFEVEGLLATGQGLHVDLHCSRSREAKGSGGIPGGRVLLLAPGPQDPALVLRPAGQ